MPRYPSISKNKNIQALTAALGKVEAATALEQIPFKSQNRYIPPCVGRTAATHRVLVLGAIEMLLDRLQPRVDVDAIVHEWQGKGLRILLFTEATE